MHDRLGTEHTLGDSARARLDDALLRLAIDEHERDALPRMQRLWRYFRNPSEPVGPAAHRLAQEAALPARITGRPGAHPLDPASQRREVVIENDIAWRLQTMVDFLLSRPPRITSLAQDPATRTAIERALDAAWQASGGLAMLQDAALLAHIYGHIDLAVRIDEDTLLTHTDPAAAATSAIRFEPIEPTRGIPILSPADYRALDAYLIHTHQERFTTPRSSTSPRRDRLLGREARPTPPQRTRTAITEVFEPGVWRLLHDGAQVASRTSRLLPGVVPVVHLQNMSQPFRYAGISEVEPLIPLQDELNTRLSDRASRVTLQSFKMYLAKNLDGFDQMPVAPGVVWSTDNPGASIEAFGADADSPSERSHIQEIREALDKISAVPPLAGGVVRAKIGNLSSANALRITLMSLLAKTARKRTAYSAAITRASQLALQALDAARLLPTAEHDRALRIDWPDALPADPASPPASPNEAQAQARASSPER